MTNGQSKVTNDEVCKWAKNGDLEALKGFKGNLNQPDDDGQHPIWHACASGHLPVVQFLSNFAPIDQREANYNASYLPNVAAAGGHLAVLEFLASRGAPLDKCGDYSRKQPIHCAACEDHYPVVEFLVSRGVPLDQYDAFDNHPLHYACSNGNLQIVKLLASKGVPLDVMTKHSFDVDGNTPIHNAITCRHFPVVKFLAEQGARLDQPDKGYYAVHYACRREGPRSLQILKYLSSQGALLNQSHDTYKICPIHLACARDGAFGMVEFLVSQGVPVDEPDYIGRLPVHIAAEFECIRTLQFLTRQDGTWGSCPLGALTTNGRSIGDCARGKAKDWWNSAAIQARLKAEAAGGKVAAAQDPKGSATNRSDLFENDGRPMGPLVVPSSSGGLSLGKSLQKVGEHLGLWDKWQQFVPGLLSSAGILASQEGAQLAKQIGDPEMAAAITVYTSETTLDWEDQIYCRLTQCLRARKPGELQKWNPFLYYLLGGMARLDSFEGKVFRGVGAEVKNLKYYEPCETVVWTTLSSTSTDKKAAEEFLCGKLADGDVGTFFAITTHCGKSIAKLSLVPDEDEVLLPVNSEFLVVSKESEQKVLPNGRGLATVWVITMVQQKQGGRKVWG